MPLSQSTLEELRKSHGAEATLGQAPTDSSTGTVPYGFTLVGSLNQIERIAEHMNEYNLSYADLTAEKQGEYDRAHEALQYHIKNLSNVMVNDMVGNDGSITMPDGTNIDLPLAATSGVNNANIPNKP